jgi:hypothetical protein
MSARSNGGSRAETDIDTPKRLDVSEKTRFVPPSSFSGRFPRDRRAAFVSRGNHARPVTRVRMDTDRIACP